MCWGLYPGDPGAPGGDCAGTVAAVGSNWQHRFRRAHHICPMTEHHTHAWPDAPCMRTLPLAPGACRLHTHSCSSPACDGRGSGWATRCMARATGCLGMAVVADARTLWHQPPAVATAEAAAMPTVFLTAATCLLLSAPTSPGSTVLVHAATGALMPPGHAAMLSCCSKLPCK